jgi:hypothetical protein
MGQIITPARRHPKPSLILRRWRAELLTFNCARGALGHVTLILSNGGTLVDRLLTIDNSWENENHRKTALLSKQQGAAGANFLERLIGVYSVGEMPNVHRHICRRPDQENPR